MDVRIICPTFAACGTLLMFTLASLYTALYRHCLSRDEIAELTIEDPAEAFEDLRDKTDLRMLFNHKEFMDEAYGDPTSGKSGKLGPPSDKVWIESWRKRLKMAMACLIRSVVRDFGLRLIVCSRHAAAIRAVDGDVDTAETRP